MNGLSLLQNIDEIAGLAGRDPADVTVIAVSKKQPPKRISSALTDGQRHFGENIVQEAQSRWPAYRDVYPDITLHLIGALQTNKVAEAVRLFDVIHSVDRPKLVDALIKEMTRQHKTPRCLIQVNSGNEPQKYGISLEALPELLDYCRNTGLMIDGLMCIPPANEPARPHFDKLSQAANQLGLKELSMGMSGDYEQAIAAGATYLRIGTAFFGERQTLAE